MADLYFFLQDVIHLRFCFVSNLRCTIISYERFLFQLMLRNILRREGDTIMEDALQVVATYKHLTKADAYFWRALHFLTTGYVLYGEHKGVDLLLRWSSVVAGYLMNCLFLLFKIGNIGITTYAIHARRKKGPVTFRKVMEHNLERIFF